MALLTTKNAGLLGGLCGSGLVWGLDQLGVTVPPLVAWFVLIACSIGLVISAGIYLKQAHDVFVRPIPHRKLKAFAKGVVGILSFAMIALPIYLLVTVANAPSATPVAPVQNEKRAALDPDRVSPLVSVDGTSGGDLVGQLVLRNSTDHNVTLLAYEYNAYGGVIINGAGPTTIPAYQTYPISLVARNNLLKGGRLDLKYDFKFEGEETVHKGYASFTIPEKPSGQIGPDQCCDGGDRPLVGDQRQTIEQQMLEDSGHAVFTAHDQNGVQTWGRVPFQLVRFNPIDRVVVFLSGPPDKQFVRTSGMARVPSGDHVIQIAWDREKKFYEMAVDGRPARHDGDGIDVRELARTL